MKSRQLKEFQKQIGIKLPKQLVDFLRKKPKLKFFLDDNLESFLVFMNITPEMPSRLLPFLRGRNGDIVSLYLPRDDRAPFVVYLIIASNKLIPLTGNLDSFLADPDSYSPDNPANDDDFRVDSSKPWKHLLYDLKTKKLVELELLKPLCFNIPLESTWDLKTLKKLTKRFDRDTGAEKSLPASLIKKAYRQPTDPLSREWWLALSDEFVVHSLYQEAIQALDNALTCQTAYPYAGYPEGDSPFPPFSYAPAFEVVEKLLNICTEHGDDFDRANLTVQLEDLRDDFAGAPVKPTESQAFVINLDVCLADVIKMTPEELEKIGGVDDDGQAVSKLPSKSNRCNFFFNIGTPAHFNMYLPVQVSVGATLRKLAEFVKTEYLAHPKEYDCGGKKLKDIRILQLVWWRDERNWFWQVVTNNEREV